MIVPDPSARLWLLDFDNTLAALEREVDWPGSRRELEAFLRTAGVDPRIFAEIPVGNLPLYAALHTRWLRAVPAAASVASPRQRGDAEALLRRASEMIERHELVGVERAAPLTGAIELLRAIAARDAVAVVVTSNSSRTAARWFERMGCRDLVRAIIGRDSLLALKPSPEMVSRAITVTGIPSTATVFVGDSLADFESACAASIGFYGIAPRESAARQRLTAAGAVTILDSPAALQTHLDRHSRCAATDAKNQ